MKYVIIDNFNGDLNIICKNDDSGEVFVANSIEEANLELEDTQNGQIIPLNVDIMYLVREMYEALRDNTSVVHIGDLISNVLGIKATFLPSGAIIEE